MKTLGAHGQVNTVPNDVQNITGSRLDSIQTF